MSDPEVVLKIPVSMSPYICYLCNNSYALFMAKASHSGLAARHLTGISHTMQLHFST